MELHEIFGMNKNYEFMKLQNSSVIFLFEIKLENKLRSIESIKYYHNKIFWFCPIAFWACWEWRTQSKTVEKRRKISDQDLLQIIINLPEKIITWELKINQLWFKNLQEQSRKTQNLWILSVKHFQTFPLFKRIRTIQTLGK